MYESPTETIHGSAATSELVFGVRRDPAAGSADAPGASTATMMTKVRMTE